MEGQPDDLLKRREEEKRDAAWDPLRRWQAIQNMLAWVEAQDGGRRNTPSACIEKERRLLAGLRRAAES